MIKVEGDPDNDLYGGYTCPKGRALTEQHNSSHRLLDSQKKVTTTQAEVAAESEGKGKPQHRSIKVEQAMDEIAAKVQSIVDKHGPGAVAMYIGTNSLPYQTSPFLAGAWLRGIGSKMLFTSSTIDQPGKQIASALHGGWEAGEQDFHSADTWILLGVNPVISKSGGVPAQNPGQKLKEAVTRGMQLIVIDPRKTETAKRAVLHIQPRPGEDPTILAAIIRQIITTENCDQPFLDRHTQGLEELAAAVEPFNPEYAARRAGISSQEIITAAQIFATAKRGGVSSGTGPSFATRSNLTEYLALCLNSLCGRWTRAGERLPRPSILVPAYNAREQTRAPYKAWGYGKPLQGRSLGQSAAGWPTAALADEILTEGEDQIRALICLGGNPMMAWPNQLKTQAAMEKLDLLVTLDIEMSATSQLADYVIATKLTLETPATTQASEMLRYFGVSIGFHQPHAHYTPKLVDPPQHSDVLEEWEFFYGLAQRMQVPLHPVVFYGWGKHIESPPTIVELDMKNKPTSDELIELMCQDANIPLHEVKKYPHGGIFPQADQLVAPPDDQTSDKLVLNASSMLEELSQVAKEDFRQQQSTDAYPLRLVPRRSNNFMNSSGRNLEILTKDKPYNPTFMHPDDIDRYGVRAGDVVKIESVHGKIYGVVEADSTLRPGVVAMTHAFGGLPSESSPQTVLKMGSNLSLLVSDEVESDRITGMPRFGAIPIAISAIS